MKYQTGISGVRVNNGDELDKVNAIIYGAILFAKASQASATPHEYQKLPIKITLIDLIVNVGMTIT